ncbi:radical SAM protein [Roseibium sp. RKSG952]|nr:radical SAM protein [Roseibium sp. RKSG952]
MPENKSRRIAETGMSKTYLYQINVTRDCNLRCTHCYIHSLTKKMSGKMEEDSVIKIATGIAKHMGEIGYDHAEIHLIGGEPTMLGPVFFENVIPKVREILKSENYSYELCLVSNLMHPEIVRIASLFDRVNTSWEPVSRFPKPKLEQMWRDSMQKLREAGIKFGVTTSVTKPVVNMGAEKILEYLHGQEGIKNIHFGFFIPSGDGLENKGVIFPEFHETSAFLIDAAEWYLRHREDPELFVNPAESMLAAIHTNTPLDDIVCPIIAGSMDIDWNGNAATCLEAGGATDAKWSGNVIQTSVSEVANTQSFRRDVIKAARPNRACIGCDAYDFCRSGCGVLARHWEPGKDQDCPGFKGFIDHMRSRHAEGLRPKYESYVGGSVGC